jgi:DnaJ family protein B protein 12
MLFHKRWTAPLTYKPIVLLCFLTSRDLDSHIDLFVHVISACCWLVLANNSNSSRMSSVISEVNKEQAEACASRGLRALAEGDFETAARLLAKAQRLHDLGPSVSASLAEARARLGGGSAGDSPMPSPTSPPSARSSGTTAGAAAPSSAGGSAGDGLRFRGTPSAGSSGAAAPASSGAASAGGSAAAAAAAARRAAQRGSGGGGSGATASAASGGASTRPYTPEQAAFVRKLKGAKDFYELLGVPRDADEDTIKRAYKKIALKIHPDKNTAPGAEEAFKRLANSQTVLLDPQARAHHDRYGEVGPAGSGGGGGGAGAPSPFHQGRGGHPFHFHGGGGDIDPSEIFNMFFQGGFNGMPQGGGVFRGPGGAAFRTGAMPGMRPRGAAPAQNQQNDQGISLRHLMSFLPMIIFLLFQFINLPTNPEPNVSSLWQPSQTQSHQFRVETSLRDTKDADNGLPYFVTRNVREHFNFQSGLRRSIEEEVLRDYSEKFRNSCRTEKRCEKLKRYFPAEYAHLFPSEGGEGGSTSL